MKMSGKFIKYIINKTVYNIRKSLYTLKITTTKKISIKDRKRKSKLSRYKTYQNKWGNFFKYTCEIMRFIFSIGRSRHLDNITEDAIETTDSMQYSGRCFILHTFTNI